MKPYGNENAYRIEALTSTKHFPNRSANCRNGIKRSHTHVRRAKDKAALRREIANN